MAYSNHLNICSNEDDSSLISNVLIDSDGKISYAFEARFIQLLTEALKVTFTMKYPANYSMGEPLPNGSWSGLIGMVQNGECDIAVDNIAVTEERSEVISYTYPYHIGSISFLTNKPEPSPKSLALIYPFTVEVWVAFLMSFFCMVLLFYLMFHKNLSFGSIMWVTYSVTIGQSCNSKFNMTSHKLIFLSWVTGTLFLIYSYQATLLSFLSVPTMVGVRTIPDLSKAVAKGSHICATYPGSYVIEILETSPDEAMKIIGKAIRENYVSSDEPGKFLKSLGKGKGAFVTGRILLSHLSKKYFLSKDSFFMSVDGVVTRKSYPDKIKLNKIIRRITEAGFYLRFIHDKSTLYTIKHPPGNTEKGNEQLFLKDIGGAFVFLMVGESLAVIFLLIEICFHRMHKQLISNYPGKQML